MSNTNYIAIRKLNIFDKGLLIKWLSNPLVAEFYGGRDKINSPEQIDKEYFSNNKQDILRMIILYNNIPIGYGQIYKLEQQDFCEYDLEDQNQIVYGMDQFIGEPEYFSKGIGTMYVKMMLEYLKKEKNADSIIIDPQVDNIRAIKCYEKAGFSIVKLLPKHELHEGKMKDCLLMEYISKK